jgi:hypothetical protein
MSASCCRSDIGVRGVSDAEEQSGDEAAVAGADAGESMVGGGAGVTEEEEASDSVGDGDLGQDTHHHRSRCSAGGKGGAA